MELFIQDLFGDKSMGTLENVETLIFCDETKFCEVNNDKEDAVYYLGNGLITKPIVFFTCPSTPEL